MFPSLRRDLCDREWGAFASTCHISPFDSTYLGLAQLPLPQRSEQFYRVQKLLGVKVGGRVCRPRQDRRDAAHQIGKNARLLKRAGTSDRGAAIDRALYTKCPVLSIAPTHEGVCDILVFLLSVLKGGNLIGRFTRTSCKPACCCAENPMTINRRNSIIVAVIAAALLVFAASRIFAG